MRRELAAGLIVFVVALAALASLRSAGALHPPFPKDRAEAAARANPVVAHYLQGHDWTEVSVIALDETHWRVTFTDGSRSVLDAAVNPAGAVDALQEHPPGGHPAGSTTLWGSPALIVVLAALFAFAVAATPLRSTRNLDAIVIAAGFTLSALLFDARLVGPQVLAGAATLAYVAFRCIRVGFGREHPVRAPLIRRALGAHTDAIVLALTAAAAVLGAILIVRAQQPSDVAFAGLAGATLLNHGTIPYGHLPGVVVHGDTYPLLSYVLYMPFAAFGEVRSAADSLDGALWLNALALIAAAVLLLRNGRGHALAWLVFPPVILAASSGGNDVPAAVFVIAALLTFERPLGSVALLTLAGWIKVVPAVALVAWIPRLRDQHRSRALATVAALVGAGLLAIAIVGGSGALTDAWHALRFQFVRGSFFSVWQQTGTRSLQPIFQAATLGFAAAVAVHAHRARPGLRRSAALAAAVIALLQIGANYWTYTYLPWLLPFILVALFPAEPRRSPRPAPRAP